MFKLTHQLPKKYWIACSGGVDSVAVLEFLAKPSRQDSLLGVVHINHGTDYANSAQNLVNSICKERYNIKVLNFYVDGKPSKGSSAEDWWRKQRYSLFNKVSGNEPIVLAHHMDDCLEEYLMCVLIRGHNGTIPYQNGRCIRPFRMWKKEHILKFAKNNDLLWIDDPSNNNTKYKRNYIRKELVPQALKLNPGLYNLVERAIKRQDEWNNK